MQSAQAPRFPEHQSGNGKGNSQKDGQDVTPWVAAEELQPLPQDDEQDEEHEERPPPRGARADTDAGSGGVELRGRRGLARPELGCRGGSGGHALTRS